MGQLCQKIEMSDPFYFSNSGKGCWKCPHEGCNTTWTLEDQPHKLRTAGDCRLSYINHIVADHDGIFCICPECGKEFERKEKTKVHIPSSSMYKTLDTYYQEKLAFHLLTQHKIIFKGKTKASRDAYLCQHKLDSGKECGFAHTELYIFQKKK